jgi:hypothetical protein
MSERISTAPRERIVAAVGVCYSARRVAVDGTFEVVDLDAPRGATIVIEPQEEMRLEMTASLAPPDWTAEMVFEAVEARIAEYQNERRVIQVRT